MSKGDLKISGNKIETEGRIKVTLVLRFFPSTSSSSFSFLFFFLLSNKTFIYISVITQIDLETLTLEHFVF